MDVSPEKMRRADWLLQMCESGFLPDGMFSLPSSATMADMVQQKLARLALASECCAALPPGKRRRLLFEQRQPYYSTRAEADVTHVKNDTPEHIYVDESQTAEPTEAEDSIL